MHVLAAGGAVELVRLVVPGEPTHRICSIRRIKGVKDAFGVGWLGGSEHVHDPIVGGVASGIGDAIDVTAGIEKKISVGVASGGGGSAERIQDRVGRQLAVDGG